MFLLMLLQARRHGGISGPCPLKSVLVPPQSRNVPPSEDCAPKKSNKPGATEVHFRGLCPGPSRGGFRGYIVPGPRWARKSSGAHVRFWCRTQWRMHGTKFQRRPFFWSSPNFGQKIGLNISEDLFFFFFFFLVFSLVPKEIWGPGIDLRTPWRNFSQRPCLCLLSVSKNMFLDEKKTSERQD